MNYTRITIVMIIGLWVSSVAAQEFQLPDPDKWYRLDTRYNGSDDRRGRCIELGAPDTEYADTLYSAKPLSSDNALSDYQYWRFEEDPANPGHYAMICKAVPDGYVNPNPTSLNYNARWTYEYPDTKLNSDKYEFLFITNDSLSGVDAETGYSYCAIATEDTGNWYMNCGGPRQNYAINLWFETYSEDANEWSFAFVERVADIPTEVAPVKDDEGVNLYYDLMGRMVKNPEHGIYIYKNHKIVL